MADLKIYKETALPGTLEANALYLVAPAANPTGLEVYATNAAGDAARRVPTINDINAMIDAKLVGGGGGALVVVEDIAARDAIPDPDSGAMVLVLDASDDATVDAGAATYVYVDGDGWVKISEAESLDLNLTWANIEGRPNSSAVQIDSAVSSAHSHSNKTELDLIGQDGDGNLTYNGARPVAEWASTGW